MNPASIFPFSELVRDGVVTPGFGPGDRCDPFWSIPWANQSGGAAIIWRSLESERAVAAAGIRTPLRPGGRGHQPLTQEAAIALLNKRRSRRITLGAINLWRAITSQQLAAITGQSGLASSRSDETALLFDAGLVQRGRVCYAGRALAEFPEVFRPNPQAGKIDLRQHLRYADWMGVTLGTPPLQGHQYDRHNLLATELSLRAAELCPLRSVLGESAAGWPRLFDSKLRPNPHRSADAVWVRDDGLKIAIEVTATFTAATATKIEQLAELLARDTTKSILILFVLAAHPGSDHELEAGRRLRQAIRKSSHASRSRVLAKVSDRLLIMSWRSAFPGPGLVSRDFVPLRAQKYSSAGNSWVAVDLLDPYEIQFDGDPYVVEETSHNLNSVFGTPWHMRTGPGFDFDTYLLKASGFDKVLEIDARRRALVGRDVV